MPNRTAEELVQAYVDWLEATPNYRAHLLEEAVSWAGATREISSGGGDTETPGLTDDELRASPLAVTLPTSQGNALLSLLTNEQLRASPVPVSSTNAAALTTSTQTLGAPGISNIVSGGNKSSIGAQLIWTGSSGNQVVRLEGTFNGTIWSPVTNVLPGEIFTQTTIQDHAAANLAPLIVYPAQQARHASYRLNWVSGNGSLQIIWGLA